jgi:hypothetical protein
MGMARDAVLIESDEHGIVVFLCPVFGLFAALVEELLSGKEADHLTVQEPGLYQVGIDAAHVAVGIGKRKRFFRLRLLLVRRVIDLALFAAQQHGHGLGIAQVIKLPHEIDGVSAAFRGVIIPLVAPDGDAVVGCQPLFPAAGDQLLSAPLENVYEIHVIGAEFLLVCKMNISAHGSTSYRWRLPMR